MINMIVAPSARSIQPRPSRENVVDICKAYYWALGGDSLVPLGLRSPREMETSSDKDSDWAVEMQRSLFGWRSPISEGTSTRGAGNRHSMGQQDLYDIYSKARKVLLICHTDSKFLR